MIHIDKLKTAINNTLDKCKTYQFSLTYKTKITLTIEYI